MIFCMGKRGQHCVKMTSYERKVEDGECECLTLWPSLGAVCPGLARQPPVSQLLVVLVRVYNILSSQLQQSSRQTSATYCNK